MTYLYTIDFLWILLIALLLAAAFSYGSRERTYMYDYSTGINFLLVLLGSILLGYFLVWFFSLLNLAFLTDTWDDVIATLIGGLIVMAILWWLGSEIAERT